MKAAIAVIIVMVLLGIGLSMLMGLGGWGPTREEVGLAVLGKHIDTEGGGEDAIETSYMVVTEKGVFEVDNGIMLGVYNADELYGKIEVGKKYTFKTMGNRYQNWFLQEFPFIVEVTPWQTHPQTN